MKMLMITIVLTTLLGCQGNMRRYQGRAVGTGSGAALGALAGKAFKIKPEYAALGGAVLGYLGGSAYDENERSQENDGYNRDVNSRLQCLEDENRRLRTRMEVDQLRSRGWKSERRYNTETGRMEEFLVKP